MNPRGNSEDTYIPVTTTVRRLRDAVNRCGDETFSGPLTAIIMTEGRRRLRGQHATTEGEIS